MKKEELIQILEELHPKIDYDVEKSLIDSGIFDSMDIVALISEIAETFEVRVPANKIVPENFNSAESIYELLQELE